MKSLTSPNQLGRLIADTRGASAVEYGLIVAAIMLAIFVSLSQMGLSLQKLAYLIADQLSVASR